MVHGWSRWWFGMSRVMFGVLAAAVLAGVAIFMYLRGESRLETQATHPPTVYLRDAFTASVLGKSENQVLDAVGKPDGTSEDAQATYWHYRHRTQNPTTGETDSDVQLVFERGRVIALNY